ncbi:MAG: hypothetical protein WBA93_24590 [Microcoleaceae cyanobacterium]
MKNFKWMKGISTGLSIVAINLVLAFIGLEAVSLGFYFSQEKQLFYTRENTISKIREDLEKTGTRLGGGFDDKSIIERLHPFFAFVLEPGAFTQEESGLKVNNYGFFSVSDYPFVKTNKNQFVIGVFGGSVASDFALNSIINEAKGNEGFIQYLKNIPQLKDKEIIVLSFASGGYKQPQQLLILNYFISIGQEFDLVINIDGFNEVALSNLNNQAQVELALPSVQHIQPLTGLANNDLSVMKAIVEISELKDKLLTAINKLESCKLALCHSFRSWQVKQFLDSYQKQVINYDEKIARKSNKIGGSDSLVYFTKMPAVLEDDVAFEKMSDIWYDSSLTMNQILSSRNIPYFHFIQPNQYYPTQRVFTEEEKFLVIENHPYAEGIKKGYPVLLSKVDDLQKENVNVFSAVTILDDEKSPVYRDACCHYNMIGETILEKYIANSIESVIVK